MEICFHINSFIAKVAFYQHKDKYKNVLELIDDDIQLDLSYTGLFRLCKNRALSFGGDHMEEYKTIRNIFTDYIVAKTEHKCYFAVVLCAIHRCSASYEDKCKTLYKSYNGYRAYKK